MTSKLDQLNAMTVVVADTGDLEAVRRLAPQDCTTNPSLVLKAMQSPAMQDKFTQTVARLKGQSNAVAAIVQDLTVGLGAELAAIVPGRVSTEVDARLSFDKEGSIAKARALIDAYAKLGVGADRILIKLAATWEGIQAARVLEREGIQCNLTLLFSMAQAKACADAGVFLISPFVGRITDWFSKATGQTYTAEEDPGVLSVRRIYDHYKSHGIATVVMGASFRNPGQIEALAGCDRLTISTMRSRSSGPSARGGRDSRKRATAGSSPASSQVPVGLLGFARNSSQATLGTSPCTAAKAIGMPKPKATPR